MFGRWCDDAVSVMRELAALKAKQAPPLLRACARHAWSERWWGLIGVGVQRAVAEALLRDGGVDLQASPPTTDTPPLAEVLADGAHA